MATLKNMKSLSDPSPEANRAMQLKKDWNDFIEYAKKKGIAGRTELDKGVGQNNLGMQYVRQYKKENPNSLISPETISEVQTHFKNYRDFAINEIKNKRATWDGDTSKIDAPDSPFMKDLSVVDGIPGSRTTSWKFPNEFLITIYKAPDGKIEKKETVNQGLASIKSIR